MQKIQSIAGPDVIGDHIGESVHRSAMAGSDPNPDKSRNLIDNYPMFNYPTGDDPNSPANGIPKEDPPSVKIDPAKIEAAKQARAKEDEKEH